MAVRITDHGFSKQEQVDADLVLQTVEKNRDRVRTTAGMLLTLSGILISFLSAVVLFLVDKEPDERSTIAVLASAAGAFVTVAVLAISATFLRTKYSVSDKAKFVTDLLRLYNRELLLLRFASTVSILGLLLLVLGAANFVWRRLT